MPDFTFTHCPACEGESMIFQAAYYQLSGVKRSVCYRCAAEIVQEQVVPQLDAIVPELQREVNMQLAPTAISEPLTPGAVLMAMVLETWGFWRVSIPATADQQIPLLEIAERKSLKKMLRASAAGV